MADNATTKTGITVRADAYNPASIATDIAALVKFDPDWNRPNGYSDGHYIVTTAGIKRPLKTGEYVIQKGGSVFVIDATGYAALFQ